MTPGERAQYRNRMQDSARAGTPRWHRLAIVAANPRGAIYGTIVATAVIAASAAGGKSPALILVATVATLVVFWLAHVVQAPRAGLLGAHLMHPPCELPRYQAIASSGPYRASVVPARQACSHSASVGSRYPSAEGPA